jgi:hypothetical protein
MTIDELARLQHALISSYLKSIGKPPLGDYSEVTAVRRTAYEFVAAGILARLRPEGEAKP